MDPAMAAEGFTRLTHEIEPIDGGVTKLTVIHELEGAPTLARDGRGRERVQGAGGGWAWVLSRPQDAAGVGRGDGTALIA